jgi:hypothetical protein
VTGEVNRKGKKWLNVPCSIASINKLEPYPPLEPRHLVFQAEYEHLRPWLHFIRWYIAHKNVIVNDLFICTHIKSIESPKADAYRLWYKDKEEGLRQIPFCLFKAEKGYTIQEVEV